MVLQIEPKERKEEHLLVKKYLKEHSLVESNITSFNNFINIRMQEIVNELNESINNEETEVKLGKVRVGTPEVIEADGSHNLLTPTEARIRGLTYSAPVYLEIEIKQEGQLDRQEVEIGKMPVIVKSDVCNLAGMDREKLIENYIDPLDMGGYFIINGNERIMVMSEDLAANQPFIEKTRGTKKGLMLRLFSQRGSYRIPVTITDTAEGILNLSFSRFRDIPAVIILKALGLTKEADIARYIGKENDSLIVNLYEYTDIQNAQDAMVKIAELTALQGTQKEILDRVKQRLDSYLLPHIGLKKEDRIEKAITLCKFIKQFFVAKENPGELTDKDHYANKRVRMSGNLLSDLFRVNLNILVRDIQHSLQKIQKRKRFYSIKSIAKSTLFTHRVESAIATGNWIGERTGVTQNMDKTNYLAILSQLQRVSSMLPGEQENFLARTLHPTHYGRFCPIETPEGTEIGLRKNLALLAKVSSQAKFEAKDFIKALEDLGMKKEMEAEGTDVFYNGRFIGHVENYQEFMNALKKKRRTGEVSSEISIRFDKALGNVLLSSEVGRVMRPVIIVENGKQKLTEEHMKLLREDSLSWDDLVKNEIVEYLDAAEEENALVALVEEDITEEHTHLEIDKIDLFGVVTSLVPYTNFDQSSRMIRGSKTQKQGLGLYAANFFTRIDTDVSILHYPQRPLVRSFVYDTLNVHPAGQNVVVAVMTHDGYNMEDALILNQGSIDRGLGRSTYFRPYTSVELNYAGGLRDEVTIPEKDVSGYRTEENYRFLEDDGLAYPEAQMKSGEVVIGKTSPPKFLSEVREISIKAKKEASSVIRQEEKGTVDTVYVTQDDQGNKVIRIKTRDNRVPELGDKFATSHGQKGVIGAIVPENDIPFTSNGIKPDVIFNPHSIPGRMTVGYLIELLAGKVSSLTGKIVDGTAFSGLSIDDLEGKMKELGFREDGKETIYNGITGRMMKVKIYVGTMYYLKLKYMVKNKMHARASGKVTLLTRQPIEGRARGGALRLGEMEQQALVAHGASLLLKERYDSDKVVIPICSNCGGVAIEDTIRGKLSCPLCSSQDIEPVEMSYAFKLLIDEIQSMHVKTKFNLKNKYD